MHIPTHLEEIDFERKTVGYRFEDGSILEADAGGDYRITDAGGSVLIDTLERAHWKYEMRAGAMGWRDYGEVIDDIAAFLGHDAEMYEMSPRGSWGMRYPASASTLEEAELIFPLEVAAWADAHSDELSILACYREDKELEEEVR